MTRLGARWGRFVSVEHSHSAAVWTATGLERQVFLDRSGRRRRRFGALGTLLAMLATVWLTALVTGSVGFSSLPALPSTTANVPAKPATHRAHLAEHGARVANRDPRHHAFKVADVERAASAKRLAGSATHPLHGAVARLEGRAFGRLKGQIQLD